MNGTLKNLMSFASENDVSNFMDVTIVDLQNDETYKSCKILMFLNAPYLLDILSHADCIIITKNQTAFHDRGLDGGILDMQSIPMLYQCSNCTSSFANKGRLEKSLFHGICFEGCIMQN